jgi:RIO kinase 1
MYRSDLDDDLIDMEDNIGYVPRVKNMNHRKKNGKPNDPNLPAIRKQAAARALSQVAANTEEQFKMTYKAALHEGVWLEQSLINFFHHKWFADVVRMVKGGKEASVYLCLGNETTGLDLLAAKVYRPRMVRNLKNDWLYREGRSNLDESGREITNKGMVHAMRKRTEFGRTLLHTSWLEHEYKTLELLKDAGADVPRPLASDSNAILMEYYGDEVMSAPTLNDVSLTRAEARVLFDRVVHNIDLMLAHKRIHADLSAYNILYWEGDIFLIDFPQAINPDENRSAFVIFQRDVARVCEYFQRQGVTSNPRKLAGDLWQRHQEHFVPLIDPKALGEEEDNNERQIWESLKNK